MTCSTAPHALRAVSWLAVSAALALAACSPPAAKKAEAPPPRPASPAADTSS
jgi:hypothetical protein